MQGARLAVMPACTLKAHFLKSSKDPMYHHMVNLITLHACEGLQAANKIHESL